MAKSEVKIDEKWSVTYDPENNDYPQVINRYGRPWADWKHHCGDSNFTLAMFYELLAAKGSQ